MRIWFTKQRSLISVPVALFAWLCQYGCLALSPLSWVRWADTEQESAYGLCILRSCFFLNMGIPVGFPIRYVKNCLFFGCPMDTSMISVVKWVLFNNVLCKSDPSIYKKNNPSPATSGKPLTKHINQPYQPYPPTHDLHLTMSTRHMNQPYQPPTISTHHFHHFHHPFTEADPGRRPAALHRTQQRLGRRGGCGAVPLLLPRKAQGGRDAAGGAGGAGSHWLNFSPLVDHFSLNSWYIRLSVNHCLTVGFKSWTKSWPFSYWLLLAGVNTLLCLTIINNRSQTIYRKAGGIVKLVGLPP